MEEEKLESMLDLSSVAIKILAKYVDIECSVDRHEIGEAMKEYATRAIGQDRERIEQTLESVDDNPILLIDELKIELP